jgi:hypothetical protein
MKNEQVARSTTVQDKACIGNRRSLFGGGLKVDCRQAPSSDATPAGVLLGSGMLATELDRLGYDSDVVRRQIEATCAAPNIPPKANRRCKPCVDRLATNFLAAVCIAATVSYWYESWPQGSVDPPAC